MGGHRILLEGPRFVFEVLLGPGSRQPSRMSEMYHSEFNFTPVGTKRSGDLPVAVITAHTITDCGFWRLVTILPSVLDEDAQNSIVFLVNSLLDVEFLLVSEDQIGQHAFCNVLQKFPAFFGPHSHMTI